MICTHIAHNEQHTAVERVCGADATHRLTLRLPLLSETITVYRCRAHANWIHDHIGDENIIAEDTLNAEQPPHSP